MTTQALFRDDAYLRTAEARVVALTGEGGVVLDRTVFYATSGGQPCGGTHVAATGEVGAVHIAKIEKKGRENRRFRIRFGAMPAAEG